PRGQRGGGDAAHAGAHEVPASLPDQNPRHATSMTHLKARSAECRVPSPRSQEQALRLHEEAMASDVVVLVLSEIKDEWERALAQRLGDEQIKRMRREMQAQSNIERIR